MAWKWSFFCMHREFRQFFSLWLFLCDDKRNGVDNVCGWRWEKGWIKYGEQNPSRLSELLICLHFVLTPWINSLKTPAQFYFFLCFWVWFVFFLNLKSCFSLESLQQNSEFLSSWLSLIGKCGIGGKKVNMKTQIHRMRGAQEFLCYPKHFGQQQKLRHRFSHPHPRVWAQEALKLLEFDLPELLGWFACLKSQLRARACPWSPSAAFYRAA